ncbi:hypothetical protein C8R44DRAFT_710600 [Mycena epipterygia]|nr:hypothetical protein C8R44DRAFT_710600 [Mycena epipterygia]
MSSVLQSVVSSTDSPALARALPYAKSAVSLTISSFSAIFRTIFAALAFLAKIAAHPIVFLSPFPLLLYILAPVIVFIHLFLDIAVYTPYRAILYVSDAFYPAYVFLGVACITGALVGLSGRLAVLAILYLVPPTTPQISVDSRGEKMRRIP